MKHVLATTFVVVTVGGVGACVQSSGTGDDGGTPPPAGGTITVDGTAHELTRPFASTNADGSEYVNGKKLFVAAFSDDPKIDVFLDFDDVTTGTARAREYGTPSITVRFDDVEYRPLAADIEIVDGSLADGAALHVKMAAATFASACGAVADEKQVALDLEVPVDRNLGADALADAVPSQGAFTTTFTVSGEEPVDYVGRVGGEITQFAQGRGWALGSGDPCGADDLVWQFQLDLLISTQVGVAVVFDGSHALLSMQEIDKATSTLSRQWLVTTGTVTAREALADDVNARAHMEIDGAALVQVNDAFQAIPNGSTVTFAHADVDGALGGI